MRILSIDIETTPNLAHVWGLWDQNIGLNQLFETSEVFCFAAQWEGSKTVIFKSAHHDGKEAMIQAAHNLLDEADAILTYNGKRFDAKHLNREFVAAGLAPPSPYKHIDLLQVVKRNFAFPSNKLAYVSEFFGLDGKVQHEGHELWVKCLAGDEKAWRKMRAYNKRDVTLLWDLHAKLLPWIQGYPNRAMYDGVRNGCKNCASTHLQKRGFDRTLATTYQRLQCQDCGTWQRGDIVERQRSKEIAA